MIKVWFEILIRFIDSRAPCVACVVSVFSWELPLDGNAGSLPEYIIPKWLDSGAVRVDRVSGVNPEF